MSESGKYASYFKMFYNIQNAKMQYIYVYAYQL